MTTKLIVAVVVAVSLWAQRVPTDAKARLFFPQIADGGPTSGRWQTTITLVNPTSDYNSVRLEFIDDRGARLELDFGQGASSSIWPEVPPNGSLVLRSRMTSATVRQGYAVATSTSMRPIRATISFRLFVDGKAMQEVTAPATTLTLDYSAFANRATGIALANPFEPPTFKAVDIDLLFRSSDGRAVGNPVRLSLNAGEHVAFNLWEKIPEIGTQEGVIELHGVNGANDTFLAWSMNTDPSGTFSSQPGGTFEFPIDDASRIWDVFTRFNPTTLNFNLQVSKSPTPNAFFNSLGSPKAVVLTHGVSELLAASESELAFVVGHMYGHSYQGDQGSRRRFDQNDAEVDADMWGLYLSMKAGYDPYAALGALAKLSMATGQAGLTPQFDSKQSAEASQSLNARVQAFWATLSKLCQLEARVCEESISKIHPRIQTLVSGQIAH